MLAEFNYLSEDGCLDVGEGDFSNILIITILCIIRDMMSIVRVQNWGMTNYVES